MAGITPESIDRLHANLLTSGVQQQNQALFYVVDQLINAVRQALSGVQTITGGGGGGGGGIAGQSFLTMDPDTATLPNSAQLVTSNLNINRSGSRFTINSTIPFPRDGVDGIDGFSIPGIQGPRGIAGIAGPPGMDAYCEECCEPIIPLPIGLLYASLDVTITGQWNFDSGGPAGGALFVTGVNGPASIIANTNDAASAAQILLSSANGVPVGISKQDNQFTLSLPSDVDEMEVIGGATSAGIALDHVLFPATPVPSADPNSLDTYAEGTWTPSISFGGSTVGITYGQQAGEYIKIGKFVACFGLIVLTSKGAAVGAASLDGFPHTFNNDGVGGNTCSKVGYTLFTAGVQEVGLQAGGSGGTSALPVKSVGGTNTGMTDADFTNTCAMILYLCYKADS